MFWTVSVRKSGANSYEAVVPDLPGCVVTRHTKARALTDIHLAIETRVAELLGKDEAIPDTGGLEEHRRAADAADTEWFSVHVNIAHLQAVARHQAGRWR